MPRDERRSPSRPTRRREAAIKPDPKGSQLLEEGDNPSGPIGSFEGRPAAFTTEGGEGANTPDRYGGPLRRRDDSRHDRNRGSGGEGGFSAIGGGTYYGEGDPDDVPRAGDWSRHATGAGTQPGPAPGSHRRSDEMIREEVCELFTRHPGIDASELEVLVEGGEVTLQGTVEDRDARWLVQDLVESVSGVSLVHNCVRIATR